MLYKYLLIILVLFSYSSSSIDLYRSSVDSSLIEIDRIEFSGNEFFTSEQLYYSIKSKESSISAIHYTLASYKEKLSNNKFTPKSIIIGLEEAIKPFRDAELKYFNKPDLINDSISLKNLYVTKGFQQAKVNYSYFKDTSLKHNVIRFEIFEGERYKLGKVEIVNELQVDKSIINSIKNSFQKGDLYFDESLVLFNRAKANEDLLNGGYYGSKFSIESAVADTVSKSIKLISRVNTQGKFKFGNTDFVHNKGNQKKISELILRKLISYTAGEIYSKKKIKNTESKLLNLGIFNKVNIIHKENLADSIVDITIICDYRKQQEFDIVPGMNRTEDNFNNLFLRISYEHKNVFGGAQGFKPEFSVNLRNISNFDATNPFSQIEYTLAANYFSPIIFSLYDASFDIESKPLISLRTLLSNSNGDFRIFRWSFPITLPVNFKTDLDVTSMNFRLTLESEMPQNFDVLVNQDETSDSLQLQQQFLTYTDLNNYVNQRETFLDNITSLLLGVTIIRDKRNSPFYPTKGHFLNVDLELSPINTVGLTQFLKFIGDAYYYKTVGRNLVLGLKSKIGNISFLSSGNNYVPLEKQFYAGGANSVRGWQSRRLRYTDAYSDSSLFINSFVENFIGSTALVEFTAELRYDLTAPSSIKGILGDIINSSAISTFVDVGNASNWLIQNNTKFDVSAFAPQNFAYAFGLGYNYKTPIGPFRIDYGIPIYGPNSASNNYTNNEFLLRNSGDLFDGVLHLAIGYSF